MKWEVTCDNPRCDYRPPAGFEDFGPYRQLLELDQLNDLPEATCRVCGEKTLRILQGADESQKMAVGKLVVSRRVANEVAPDILIVALSRHKTGDWGAVDQHDTHANDVACGHDPNGFPNGRVVSVYDVDQGEKLLVITEQGRQVTTMMFRSEY